MHNDLSTNLKLVRFQAELAWMQAVHLARVAKEFDLYVRSAALFLEKASRDAAGEQDNRPLPCRIKPSV